MPSTLPDAGPIRSACRSITWCLARAAGATTCRTSGPRTSGATAHDKRRQCLTSHRRVTNVVFLAREARDIPRRHFLFLPNPEQKRWN
nr:MAG TPA: hypothetical protein [Caudoviricetes sp.]